MNDPTISEAFRQELVSVFCNAHWDAVGGPSPR